MRREMSRTDLNSLKLQTIGDGWFYINDGSVTFCASTEKGHSAKVVFTVTRPQMLKMLSAMRPVRKKRGNQ